jgi:hypothetical protein
MRAFTKMRQIIFDNVELRKEIENLRADVDEKFQVVFISSGLNVYPACPMEFFYPIPSG